MSRILPSFCWLSVSLLLAPGCLIAADPKTEHELVLQLTSDYRDMGLFGCGTPASETEAANELVRRGPNSLAALEEALKSLEDLRERSRYASSAHWIVNLYARIATRPRALERLREFAERMPNPVPAGRNGSCDRQGSGLQRIRLRTLRLESARQWSLLLLSASGSRRCSGAADLGRPCE